MIHRGPDDEGTFFDEHAGLGMRRLSIIDLVTGKQPIHNEGKRIWIILNGEIYNFQELRDALEKKGHNFYTKSDTEVLVHLYEDLGEGFLQKINGMFALAIWDRDKQRLFLARDRLGKKPLYYSILNDTLIFASEIKSLLQYPFFKRELDFDSLNMYLTFEFVPAPYAIFKGLKKLLPGHYLTFSKDGCQIKKYWDISFASLSGVREDEIREELRERFKEAVKKRLISDVPLGVFLSGGIDSSSIVAMMRELSVGDIKTFNVGFEDKSFDESSYAQKVAKYFGTDHYEMTLHPNEMLKLIPEVANFLDEPLGDASIIPTYLLSRFTREHVTVALGGDGGDELFAGYPTYQAFKLADYYLKIPKFLRKGLIEPAVNALPVSTANISLDFRAKRFILGLNYSPEIRNSIWLGSFTPQEKEELLTPSVKGALKEDTFEIVKFYLKSVKTKEPLEKILYLDMKMYLQDDILVKVDRASMANSLEVRAPFLDYTFVNFVTSLPVNLKLNCFTMKYVLKKAMEQKLPPGIAQRKKKGFGIPVARWFKKELKNLVLDVFESSKIKREGYFNPQYIERLLKEHFEGKRDNRKLLWTLFIFELWREKYLKTTAL